MDDCLPYVSLVMAVLLGGACSWLYRATRRKRGAPVETTGDRTSVTPGDSSIADTRPATPQATKEGDDGRQPVSSAPRTAAERPGGAKPTAPLHGRRANVPRPDDVRAPAMRPPPAEGVRARMTGWTMGASVVDILPEAHRVGWDLACEVRADTLIQAATREGEDVSHCVARGTECGGIMGCRCNCKPCTRRREIEDQAYGEIKGPLAFPLS